MSARDRMAVIILACGALLVGMWIELVSPERQQAAKAQAALAQAQSQRDLAVANEHSAEQAQQKFGANVAALSQLNKAVPANQNVAGLLHQLEATALANGVDFVSISSNSGGPGGAGAGAAPSAPPSAPAPTPSVGPTNSATSAVNKANASSTATANANPGGAPATPQAAGAASPAASAGSFAPQSYVLTLIADYPHLQTFLTAVQHWASVTGGQVSVSGPLLSIGAVKLTNQSGQGQAGATATVTLSAYSSPASAVSPSTLLAQLQPSATSPVGRAPAAAPSAHPSTPHTAVVGVTR